jgi:putative monooxygenase
MTTIKTDGHPVVGSPPDPTSAHRAEAPRPSVIRTMSMDDVAPNRRRGGDIRTILAPSTVGSTSGFMGTLTLQPGEFVSEHWHPYSEEFLFCVRGGITLRLDGEERPLRANEGVLVPIGVRHRLTNDGAGEAFFVFQLSPLAPQPRLGHVDTEALPTAGAP